MKHWVCMLSLMAATATIQGAESTNQRMNCNEKAAGTTGTLRNRIISACVKHNAAIKTMPPMLQRMTDCNRDAGNMTGQARVRFVAKCMGEQ